MTRHRRALAFTRTRAPDRAAPRQRLRSLVRAHPVIAATVAPGSVIARHSARELVERQPPRLGDEGASALGFGPFAHGADKTSQDWIAGRIGRRRSNPKA